jgi:uncharacterized protein (DUF849 family)
MTMLQVTPNGRHGKNLVPQVPVRVDEVLADLRACFELGARGVHLHVRDSGGRESLDPTDVNHSVAAVRDLAERGRVEAEISLTTGAWIVPDLSTRVRLISAWKASTVPLSISARPGSSTSWAC